MTKRIRGKQPKKTSIPGHGAENAGVETVSEFYPSFHRKLYRLALLFIGMSAGYLAYLLIADELQTSRLQARFMTNFVSGLKFTVEPGPSQAIRFPQTGPFDQRRGYTRIPEFVSRLDDFKVTDQARFSPGLMDATESWLFPPYREKSQAGLALLDCNDQPLHTALYPKRTYDKFADIPELIANSLLFIEDRHLLDDSYPSRNPAVEWGRFGKAAFDQVIHLFDEDHEAPGGSTLATQIEKFRHSPEGITVSRNEKIRQMASASLRAYQNGVDTTAVRRQILLDYLNTVPLAGKAGFGEVYGIGDGLWVWYGRDFSYVNRLLQDQYHDHKLLEKKAQAYKQVLSLFVAQRRPSSYLGDSLGSLEQLTNSHLRLLASEGVISPELRDAALQFRLKLRDDPIQAHASYVSRKAANSLRINLSNLLGVPRLYDLDRYDLTAGSTLNNGAQGAVISLLDEIKNPAAVRKAGLYGHHLLKEDNDLGKLVISFTLFERGENANFLRVQTDNYDQPFDINEGSKLDMGSTAKLRTLITYLEIIADLHQRYAAMTPAELRKNEVDKKDLLTRWGLNYLATAKNKSLRSMLEAAMDRQYSASPAESFFTGGGVHTFENFRREDNGRVMTLREGFRNSVNLVFIRLMRDVVRHHMFQIPGSSAKLLEDTQDPRRSAYLAKFADREGREFIYRFYKKYQGKTAAQARELLLRGGAHTTRQLAGILRSIAPGMPLKQFGAALREYPSGENLSDSQLKTLYQQFDPEKWSLPDRGYIAGVHPLELWLVGFLQLNPGASQSSVVAASSEQRQEVYSWLFNTRFKNAQDVRILSLLEVEGFMEILRSWQKLGYPFEVLTPSYATALGSSGDRPAALAELMGIIVNQGIRKPAVRVEKLNFALGTPYETRLGLKSGKQERVINEEIAEVVRAALVSVVTDGTARRLKGAFVTQDHRVVEVGGKTGTGDHRYDVYGSHGQLVSSRVVNRSAIFVFLIGERFFGTVTTYVPGAAAADYAFTSAISTQLLKVLAPALAPLLEEKPAENQYVCRQRPH